MKSSISSFFLGLPKRIFTIPLLFFFFFQELKTENLKTNTVNDLQKVLKEISQKNNSIFFQKTLKAVRSFYDAEKMIQMIIGVHWNNISEAKKKELTEVFQTYIASNYLRMFEKISNPSFEQSAEKKIGKNYRLIKTFLILNKDERVEINYLLLKKNEEWKIFDVLLAGSVSEIATKKSEFRKYLKNGNIEELINALKKVSNL